jgi:ketosteroid isomerase-like protein
MRTEAPGDLIDWNSAGIRARDGYLQVSRITPPANFLTLRSALRANAPHQMPLVRTISTGTMKTICVSLLLFAVLAIADVEQRAQQKNTSALDQLVRAEQQFAKTSVERGIRDSFIAFFAEDGINFQPHPTRTREAFEKRPALTGPSPVTLNWEPLFGDISQAGDIGYTTGPFTLVDNTPQKRPAQYGYYFSIWKKQQDQGWKVAVDVGIETPEPPPAHRTAFHPGSPTGFKQHGPTNLENERTGLFNRDRSFSTLAAEGSAADAYGKFLSTETRLHRNGRLPITDRDSILRFIRTEVSTMSWKPLRSEVAASNDLAYTYGSYKLMSKKANKTQHGYYVRVWKRDGKGNWMVTADIATVTPDEK